VDLNILDRAVAEAVPRLPRTVVRQVAKRYISGETLESALQITKKLNAAGMTTTLDYLGENITQLSEASIALTVYRHALREIKERGLAGNISIKLTSFGLRIDARRCLENVRDLVVEAARNGIFVRIDMEDSSTTSETLSIYRELRRAGLDNVGVVLQASMRRSEGDARELARMGARVRVCKGIYREPPEIAFQRREEISRNFLSLVDFLLGKGCHVGIATHDAALVEATRKMLEARGGCRGQYEYQMLLGVTEGLRGRVVALGHPLRVYVPFGQDWYAYSVRRLRENPQIAGHVFRALLGMGG
jgi:proline dehydrogenase